MKHSIRTVSIFFILALLISCGGNKAEEVETVVPVAVKTTSVTNQNIQGVLGFFGNVEGNQAVKVYSTVPNRVTNIKVDIGDKVKKGQVLATINADKISEGVTQAEAGYEATLAQYNTTEAEFQRAQK